MPYIPTAQEWLTLSAQLLEVQPTTTRVTTKYNISPAKAKSRAARRKRTAATTQDAMDVDNTAPTEAAAATATTTTKPPRAKLILKTYCPQNGVCLKYKTTKAAEVGRLIQMLGSLGRGMAGLPVSVAAATTTTPAVEEEPAAAGTATPPVGGGATPVPAASAGAATGGEGGKGKKKKKGKR